MNIIVLGSGTAIPMGWRASPALLMQVAGETLLFDIGPGTVRQLTRAGVNYEMIGRICLTHFHPDHTADLTHFLFATRNPSVLARRRPFAVTGPPGLAEFVARLQSAYGASLKLPKEIMHIEELDAGAGGERVCGNIILNCHTTSHTTESIAYRVTDDLGRAFVYSGDTGFSEDLADFAANATLLVLESSFPDSEERPGHLTPSQAGRIAAAAGVDRLLLIHFYPECLASDIAAQCRRSYGGELILGTDLLHLRL